MPEGRWRLHLYRSEGGQSFEVPRVAEKTREAVWIILSLGLIVSLTVSEGAAAQRGFADRHADQSGMGQFSNLEGPSLQWSADTSQDAAVDEQIAQAVGSRRSMQEELVAQAAAAEAPKEPRPVGVAPANPPKEEGPSWLLKTFLLQGPGVLTPKGTLVVEPYLQFAHLSSNRVTLTGFTIVPAITIGLINIQGVSRDIYTAALVGRYGLTNRLEVEVRVPYLYREDSITQRPIATPSQTDTLTTTNGHGLGDVETTARFQINAGGPDKPYFIGFARFKSRSGEGPFDVPTDRLTGLQTELPTGSGFYIFQPGVTLLFPTDPVVFFGSTSFIYNIPRDIDGVGRVDPGSGGNASVGLGVSLNERLSLTLGYDHTIFSKPTSASNVLLTTAPQLTHIGVLLLGGSYRWSERSFVNFVVGIGATREAPDLQLTLRIPTAFSLWK